MDLSIVIVNYRSWDDLADCLTSLAPLMEKDQPETETIVVDNASDDGRFDQYQTRFSGVRFIENPGNFGFASACNQGAEIAQGKTLLFLNPDCLDPGGAIETLWERQQERSTPAIWSIQQTGETGKLSKVFDVFPTPLNLLGPVRAVLRLLMPDRYRHAGSGIKECCDVDWVSGSVLMIPSGAFKHLGGWCDEYWMYSEDVDLCYRAREAGIPTIYCPSPTIIHKHGGSSRRDPEISALTKSEVVISKHLYASRCLAGFAGLLFHILLFLSRYISRLPAWILSMVVPFDKVTVEGKVFSRLTAYYGSAVRHRTWISPRSVRYPGLSMPDQAA